MRGTFLDLRKQVLTGHSEQGLFSIAFHPAYARNHRFYVNYTDRRGDTRIVEYRSRNRRPIKSSARQLLFVDQPYPNHNGGELQFDRDGVLYTGMGDGGSMGDPENRAQNMGTKLGKLMRIDPLRGGDSWQVLALGLRNPWRFSFDPANGDLYVGDVGYGSWEEIDYRARADLATLANYGWRVFEGHARRLEADLGPGEYVAPIHDYPHDDYACAVTGGYVYRGRAVRAAVGRYFFGDYCNGRVWSLKVAGGRAVDLRREPFTALQLTSFAVDAAGEPYLATGTGRILRLAG